MQKPKYHIFVCTSSRANGQQKGFFLSNTGCFGICEKGPVVVVYPDNVWYGSVTLDDVTEILDSHIEGGNPVSHLEL